jgi:hypothetical protein
MRTLSALLAVGSLLLTAAMFPIIGAVLFALFLFGLAGVLASLEDHTVEQHEPAMDPTGWRTGLRPVLSESRVSTGRPAGVDRQPAVSRSTPRRAA